MGRPKEYDRTELLDRAVELFRRQGFNGTSTAELVSEFGINRKSMYAEFGTKQQLFEATLDHYNNHHLSRVLGPLEAPDAGIAAIRQAFEGYASASEGWARGRGCLLCNSAVERGALDTGTGHFVDAYLARINEAFRNALENAKRTGDIDEAANMEQLAGFFATMLIGVAASIRAEAPPEQLHATAGVVSNLLDDHRPAPAN